GTLYDAAYNVISNDLFGYPQWLEAGKKYYYCTGAATEKATYTFRLEKANLMNGYSYDIMNGYATITGYFGTDSVLSIPNTVYHAGNGLPVENIERSAFSRQDMTGVTIPANVSRISAGAFSGCTKLQSIVLPDTVHYINDRAFSGCSALTRAKLSEECTRIADGLFAGCTSLKEIKIPSGVTNIGWEAFAGCVELKKVIIPSSVTRIQADAFKNCQALTIYGFTGSSAETYAQQKGIPFVPLTAGKKGDINEDGVVDREDAELLMRELCQLVTLTDAQKALAEVVNDGVLNNKDVVDILRTPAA
ncbi:MAG: leucine-rich repeat protein, partial [Clostridia bacterium]